MANVKIQVTLSEELHSKLKELATKKESTVNGIIRMFVIERLEQQQQQQKEEQKNG